MLLTAVVAIAVITLGQAGIGAAILDKQAAEVGEPAHLIAARQRGANKSHPASGPSLPQSDEVDGPAARKTDRLQDLRIIFTIDPNFRGDFEAVPINDFTKRTVLAYVRDLKDILTANATNPHGLDLLLAHEYVENDESTYRLRIDAAIRTADAVKDGAKAKGPAPHVMLPSMLLAAYQMTQLPEGQASKPSATAPGRLPMANLHFTSARSFWQTAEASASEGTLNNTYVDPELNQFVTYGINSIAGAVLFLPRWTPLVHTTEHDATTCTGKFGEPAQDWGPAMLQHIVSRFVEIAQVSTVPELPEWAANANKTALQEFYQAYYDEKPGERTPPLETELMVLPMTHEEAMEQCWKSNKSPEPSERTVQNVMQAIFEGIQRLHHLAPPWSLGRLLAEEPDAEQGGTPYILKRDYAEAAYGMTKFRFPDHMLQAPHAYKPWLARNEIPQLSNSSLPAPSHLRKAALHVIKAGCGLPWLLQYKIALFEQSEYRVYLLGGAHAKDEDIHVVYSPGSFGSHGRLSMGYETLKPGTFMNVLLPPCEGSCEPKGAVDAASEVPAAQADSLIHWQKWELVLRPYPHTYQRLISAARDGAKALESRRTADGNPFYSTNDVFIRVDVLLAMPWNATSGKRVVVTRINEMDWLNSAAVMMDLWNASAAAAETAARDAALPGSVSSNLQHQGVEPHQLPAGRQSDNTLKASEGMLANANKPDDQSNMPHVCRVNSVEEMVAGSMANSSRANQGLGISTGENSSSVLCKMAAHDSPPPVMQTAQNDMPAFLLAKLMLHRAMDTVRPHSAIEKI